jgi:hypothetical protein
MAGPLLVDEIDQRGFVLVLELCRLEPSGLLTADVLGQIDSGSRIAPRPRPRFPQQRTSRTRTATPEKCQQWTCPRPYSIIVSARNVDEGEAFPLVNVASE